MNLTMMKMNIILTPMAQMFDGMSHHKDIYAFIRGLLIIFVMDIQKILDRIMQQYFVRDGNMYGIRNSKNGIMINGR